MLHTKLPLTRHIRKPRVGWTHEGKAINGHSNLRRSWGSFKSLWWDGVVMPLINMIDTCDREVIARSATAGCCL
jgi:hypothetical protein